MKLRLIAGAGTGACNGLAIIASRSSAAQAIAKPSPRTKMRGMGRNSGEIRGIVMLTQLKARPTGRLRFGGNFSASVIQDIEHGRPSENLY
jgi:hypothetical protein